MLRSSVHPSPQSTRWDEGGAFAYKLARIMLNVIALRNKPVGQSCHQIPKEVAHVPTKMPLLYRSMVDARTPRCLDHGPHCHHRHQEKNSSYHSMDQNRMDPPICSPM